MVKLTVAIVALLSGSASAWSTSSSTSARTVTSLNAGKKLIPNAPFHRPKTEGEEVLIPPPFLPLSIVFGFSSAGGMRAPFAQFLGTPGSDSHGVPCPPQKSSPFASRIFSKFLMVSGLRTRTYVVLRVRMFSGALSDLLRLVSTPPRACRRRRAA